jgi:hypothetical protein
MLFCILNNICFFTLGYPIINQAKEIMIQVPFAIREGYVSKKNSSASTKNHNFLKDLIKICSFLIGL